jgi:hypothetical protein
MGPIYYNKVDVLQVTTPFLQVLLIHIRQFHIWNCNDSRQHVTFYSSGSFEREGGSFLETTMSDAYTFSEKERPAIEWFMSILQPGWEALVDYAPRAIETTPDFNIIALNGEDPKEIWDNYGVSVRVLGRQAIGPHSISVHGPSGAVARYMTHLMSTWPGLRL